MNTQLYKAIGLGSSFNKSSETSIQDFNLNEYIANYQLFYTGRHAIRHLIDSIQQHKTITTIWLPAYYCQHVTAWLQEVFKEQIQTYDIYPFSTTNDFHNFSFATKNDIVILNNFWGVYEYNYPTSENRPIFIEDHSHGWLSTSCLVSKADYCFASLRKTLPIALGGISWSTTRPLPNPVIDTTEQHNFRHAWNEISRAMKFKTALLNGDNGIQKGDYLQIINQFETFLHKQHTVVAVHDDHQKELQLFLNKDYAHYKKENLAHIYPKIKETPLFDMLRVKKGFTFGLELVFKDYKALNKVKTCLVKHDIYPSELWPDNSVDFEQKYLLNIHLDFRYNQSDMDYIAKTLNNIQN